MVHVRTLGCLEISARGKPLASRRKLQKKVLALLEVLIALGGSNLPEQAVADALWSDSEGDAARNALAVCLHRLRRLLGDAASIEVRAGRISIDRRRVWVDAWAFVELSTMASGPASAAEALELYRGAFLPGEDDLPGVARLRASLQLRFTSIVATEARRLECAGSFDQAVALYLQGIALEPTNEDFRRGLMLCYRADRRFPELAIANTGCAGVADWTRVPRLIGQAR